MEYVISISIAVTTFFLFVMILFAIRKDNLLLNKRLDEMGIKPEEIKPVKIRKKKEKPPVSLTLAYELSNAGIRMRTNEFLILWFICAAVIPGMLSLAGLHLVSVFTAAGIGIAIPPILVNKRKKKRLVIFEQQLGDALVLMSNCLRAGMTFQQAMANVSTEMPDPIAKEFSRTVREIQFGTNVDVALDRLVARVKSADLMITVSAIQIQREVGGNLLEILESISDTIKERIKVKNEMRVLSATGKSSGVIIGVLPIVIGGMLALINPDYIMTFFDTKMGTTMLIVAVLMESTGFLLINRIVNIKY